MAEACEPGQDLSRLLSLQVLSMQKQMFLAGILAEAGGAGTLTVHVEVESPPGPSSWKLPVVSVCFWRTRQQDVIKVLQALLYLTNKIANILIKLGWS